MAEPDNAETTQRIHRDALNIKEIKKIPVVCPWCNQVFTLAGCEVGKGEKTEVSHKICPKCLRKVKNSGEPDSSK
ncbi:MAG TPA: hypothetical protein DET40_25780 [Lentisphaeria bacterium]|nr:MAG: hypothetical protein A2X45_14870 [Lentisphaerae bacterium GWF2_50_93]HCE46972.1 hypothetical protein [Lentisphaeria bacterium]